MPLQYLRPARLALGACLLALASAALAQSGPGMERNATFRVVIDSAGKLKTAAPLDAALGPDLNRAIVGVAKDIVFEPASRDGVPAEFESDLAMTVRLTAQASGGYKLEIVSARFQPHELKGAAVVYPRGFDRKKASAFVDALIVVGADGKVDLARTRALQTVTNEAGAKALDDFRASALDAIRQWTFQPDLVGGTPVATEFAQGIRFCLEECTDPEVPPPSPERLAAPRSPDPGVRLARVPEALRQRMAGAWAKPMNLRLGIDASGAVTSIQAIGAVDAGLLESTRPKLLALHFFPATVDGRAVASEMPVSVPVRVDGGTAQVLLERLAFQLPLLAETSMQLPGIGGIRDGEVHTRVHIVTDAEGRADRSASSVESVQILPRSSAAAEGALRKQLENTIAQTRVEPVLVDGKGIRLEFWRRHDYGFCSHTGGPCVPKAVPPAPPEEGVKLPAGIELARLKP
jgi:hypothetical protein